MGDNSSIKESLDKSIVYAMSLSSKELFHSNVLAWLMKQDIEYVKIFFEGFNVKTYKVEREWHNRDIVILDDENNKYYLIENKFKSIPSLDQLEKYNKENVIEEYKLSGFVLTGLVNPFKDEDDHEWKYIDYDEIAKKIKEITDSTDKLSEINKSFVYEYCEVLKNIKQLINDELNKKEEILDYNNSLDKLRIDDVYKKLKANKFLNYIKEKGVVSDDKVNKDFKIYFGIEPPKGYHWSVFQNFHHSKATLDIRFSSWDNKEQYKKDYLVIGIEIEEYNYRLMLETNYKHGCDDNKRKELFDKFKEYGWFGDYNKEQQIVFNHNTSMSEEFNKYKVENKYIALYQHYSLDDTDREFENLYNKIKNDMEEAKKVIENKLKNNI